MSDQQAGQEQAGWQWYDVLAVAAVVVVVAAGLTIGAVRPDLLKPAAAEPAAITVQAAAGPAPTLRRSTKIMAAWIATGAGEAAYNATYTESGTYNGQPAYVSPGGIWLFNNGANWWLGPTKSLTPIAAGAKYAGGAGSDLPDNDWVVVGTGTAPAPSLSEQSAEPYWWFEDAPWIAVPNAIRPCVAVLGGEDMVARAHQANVDGQARNGFLLWRLSDYAKGWCEAEEEIAPNHDPWQTATLSDAGDGTHLWLNTGVYETEDPAFLGITWHKFAIVPAVSATPVATANCPLPSADVSTFLNMGLGVHWFVMVEGGVPKLCSCEAGGTTYTVLATYGSEADLPAGHYALTFPDTTRTDHALARLPDEGAPVYWSRRCSNDAGGAGQHRFAFYEVSEEGCELLPDVIPVSSNTGAPQPGDNLCQSWGAPAGAGILYGHIGISTESFRSVRWKPGVVAAEGDPYYLHRDRLANPPPITEPFPSYGSVLRAWAMNEEV